MEKKTNRPADRIRKLAQFYIDHKAFRSMRIFEKACGFSERYVKNICGTTHGNPGVDIIASIYNTFEGVSLHWLVLGEGDMFTVSEEDALRSARFATDRVDKESKLRSILNNKLLKGMTREEKLELVEHLLNSDK